jgi:hypothetical protein
MGLEVVVLLAHRPSLAGMLSMTWAQVDDGMRQRSLRGHRPNHDARLVRTFDIDAEAEWLDWSEARPEVDRNVPLLDGLRADEDGGEGLLHVLRWCSAGAWEVWEGRAFLYLDVLLKRELPHVDELYTEQTWIEAAKAARSRTETDLIEAVVLSWMQRREALGETLDENRDPRILPTHEAHTRNAGTLIHLLHRAQEPDLVAVVGREHLEATSWGHGAWSIPRLLEDGVPASTD